MWKRAPLFGNRGGSRKFTRYERRWASILVGKDIRRIEIDASRKNRGAARRAWNGRPPTQTHLSTTVTVLGENAEILSGSKDSTRDPTDKAYRHHKEEMAETGPVNDRPTVLEAYESMVRAGHIRSCDRQLDIVRRFTRVQRELSKWTPPVERTAIASNAGAETVVARDERNPVEREEEEEEEGEPYYTMDAYEPFIEPLRRQERKKNKTAFDDKESENTAHDDESEPATPIASPPPPSPEGIYVHGTVGSGKSMLMDLFYEHGIPEHVSKIRLHYEPFMVETHRTLHHWRLENAEANEDERQKRELHRHEMIRALARSIVTDAKVVCFDEMQIPDPAAAAILPSLFTYMLQYGCVLVCTSNRKPNELYSSHVGSSSVSTFVDRLSTRCEIVDLNADEDFRVLRAREPSSFAEEGEERASHVVTDERARTFFDSTERLARAWTRETSSEATASSSFSSSHHDDDLYVFGRRVPAEPRHVSACGRKAYFTFDELCGDKNPLGPADYLAVAQRYRTVALENIPEFTLAERNQARRLIWLVDALYERRALLYASSPDVSCPSELFTRREETGHEDVDGGGATADVMELEALGSMEETASGRFALRENAMDDAAEEDRRMSETREDEIFTGQADVFAFERCVSRMIEMSSPRWIATATHRARAGHNHVTESGAGFRTLPDPPPRPKTQEDEDEEDDGDDSELTATSPHTLTPDQIKTKRASENRKMRESRKRRESELFAEIRQRGIEEIRAAEDLAPRFRERHFFGLGKWNAKRAGKWGAGPRMSGPNPTVVIWKKKIMRALGLERGDEKSGEW